MSHKRLLNLEGVYVKIGNPAFRGELQNGGDVSQ